MFNLLKALSNIIVLIHVILLLACSTPSLPPVQLANALPAPSVVSKDSIPLEVQKIMTCYPAVIGFSDNHLLFHDGSKILFDDGKKKSNIELLENPDIQDMFTYEYRHWKDSSIPQHYDPGRIRVDSFFMKIYGTNKSEVQGNLVKVKWCPTLINQDIMVTNVNGVHLKIDSLSKELDQMPQYKEYFQKIGGTFNWRVISGTSRLSAHSFGMTIDINPKYSNYWQWDCRCKNEYNRLTYTNKVPDEIVRVFEKYGFIWGGNWYHYDTMHFEYRPELL
jgi:hypothetical protein